MKCKDMNCANCIPKEFEDGGHGTACSVGVCVWSTEGTVYDCEPSYLTGHCPWYKKEKK